MTNMFRMPLVIAISVAMTSFVSAQTLPKTNISVIASSDQSYLHRMIEKPFWTQTVPEKSGGAISVDFKGLFSSGLRGPEIIRLMRTGALDFAHGVFTSVGADDAIFEGMDLAGLAPDIATSRKISDAFKPIIDENFRQKHGIKLLAMVPFPSQVFYCRQPINGLADLKGKKVRVFGRSLADLVTAVGATSVTIPFGEVVPALQTGVVDCAITGTSGGNTAKWPEVTSHLYALPVGWAMSFYAVNAARWNQLDAGVRQLLETEIKAFENQIWEFTAKEDQDALRCNAGKDPCEFGVKAGMTVVPLVQADATELKRIMLEIVVPGWAARCGAACVEQWNKTVSPIVGFTAQAKR
jgi:TRAP-type C4-dicarboxylate transport system substrate-binding protein